MDPERSLELLGLVACLGLAGLSSAADAALTAISRHRLHALLAENQPRAQVVGHLLDDPARFKATTLTVNIAAAVGAGALALALLHPWSALWQPFLGVLVVLLLLLIVGEALPKAFVARRPDRAALLLARPLQVLSFVLRPLTGALNAVMRPLVSSGSGWQGNVLVSEEELRLLVNVGAEEGVIEKEEREMIQGILVFGDTVVREVMVPRIDIVALDADTNVEQALDHAMAAGHSRIPVYQDTIDNIVGILYLRDLVPLLRSGEVQRTIVDLVRPVYYIPEMMKVDDLLRSLKTRKVHIAIIVDEYGGTAGLVTIEDLIEEIVGEIQDEYDVEEAPAITRVDEHTWLADARISLDDINDETGLQLHTEEGDSLGGLVYEKLGSIPRPGDSVDVGNVTIVVRSVEGLRPEKLEIVVHETEEHAEASVGEEVTRDDR